MPRDGKSLDLIGYDALEQEALRGVVRAVLKRVAADGLPGDHQLLVTFRSRAPGVSGPPEVMARYPDQMMVVFKQDQFRDLAPGETFFTVTLSFGGQPRSLSVPYAAVTEFVDPAVGYHLSFSVPEASDPASVPSTSTEEDAPAAPAEGGERPNIVSLDQFRKK